MKRLLASGLLTALVAILLAPSAQAVACPQTSLLDIQDEVMCVLCGVPLVNAGGPQSDNQREFIRQRAARCQSKDQIKAALVAEFGPTVIAQPRKSGFDLVAYLVPVVALIAALTAIALGAIGWRRRQSDAPSTATDSPAEVGGLDADLQRYDL